MLTSHGNTKSPITPSVASAPPMNSLSDNLTQVLLKKKATVSEEGDAKARKRKIIYCCPWHRKGNKQHMDNFGLSLECLDCMREIQEGRCEIDVKNFDFDTFWTVRRFWNRVDIGKPDECWPWTGALRKNETETVAYFPSPHHSGTTHGAPRVAFWTSRGYVGKLRILHQDGCKFDCCNPKHLRLRELESIPTPTNIVVNLSYGAIFDRHKQTV